MMLVLASLGAFGKMPSFEEIENPHSSIATEVYSSMVFLLGKILFQNRSTSSFDEIPEMIRNCLSLRRIFAFQAFRHRLLGTGGSGTIHDDRRPARWQHHYSATCKKPFSPAANTNFFHHCSTKFKEWVIAIKLERRYTKNEILNLYLQTVEFSENSFGITSAARTYFNKTPDSLHVEEAAVLIGMLKGSTYYNPRRNPENAFKRRNIVLSQMNKYNYISKAAYDSLKQMPIKLNYISPDHTRASQLTSVNFSGLDLAQFCKDHPKPDGTQYNIYKDGLRVYTTINYKMQQYAEAAVQKHMKDLQQQFYQSYKGSVPWGKNEKYITGCHEAE
jgi:penicillin-binding protein 1A